MLSENQGSDAMQERVNRIALITGGGSGICAEVALKLAERDIKLIIIDSNSNALNCLPKTIYRNLLVPPICMDVRNLEELKNLFLNIPLGNYPDILINGVGGDTRSLAIEELNNDDYLETFISNFMHIQALVRMTAGSMKSKGWGRIINFSSIAGRTYTHFSNAAYVSSKAAIIGFTKQCAYELAPFGITVNCVAHGPINTERIENAWNSYESSQKQDILNKIPIGRLGSVKEAASIVLYLASEDSGYSTGATFDVNGGLRI
jgi:NAD(P)-dependent dehydrogenase (short-subunit alcohol dehydrogenase family)